MSIALDRVTRVNGLHGPNPRMVLHDVSYEFPKGRAVAVLGARGAGKTTLIRLLSGAILPSAGRVHRVGRVSHPIGALSWLNRFMTGRENINFLARLHGWDPRPITAFVLAMSGLGASLDQPLISYSGEKRARLGFSITYAMPFDVYIGDEALIGGPPRFRETCKHIARARLESSSFILATRSPSLARLFCDMAVVLHEGRLEQFPSVSGAVARLAEINAALHDNPAGGAEELVLEPADDWAAQSAAND